MRSISAIFVITIRKIWFPSIFSIIAWSFRLDCTVGFWSFEITASQSFFGSEEGLEIWTEGVLWEGVEAGFEGTYEDFFSDIHSFSSLLWPTVGSGFFSTVSWALFFWMTIVSDGILGFWTWETEDQASWSDLR